MLINIKSCKMKQTSLQQVTTFFLPYICYNICATTFKITICEVKKCQITKDEVVKEILLC